MCSPIECALDDCDIVFIPTRKGRIYCSANCGKKASNRRKREEYKELKKTSRGYKERDKKEYTCQYVKCGKTFMSSFYNPKYCCKICSNNARYLKSNPDRKEYQGKLGTQKMEYINPKFSTKWMQDGWDRVKHEYGY